MPMTPRPCARRIGWFVGFVVTLLVAVACSERAAEEPIVVPISDGPLVSPPELVVRDDPRVPEPGVRGIVPIFEDFRDATFTEPTVIDNEFFPLTPGTRLVLDGTVVDQGRTLAHRIEHIVTDLTKEINGVENVVLWIEDYTDHELVEAELAFYAQDDNGNVWFFGEHPEEYEDEILLDAPTWIAGVDDARAGIAMYAAPSPEIDPYFQGWGPSVDWSDFALVDSVDSEDCVIAGCYSGVLTLAESSLGEPAFQLKSFAPGIGTIRVDFRGDDLNQEMLELVEHETLTAVEMERYEALSRAMEAHAYAISPAVYGATSPLRSAGRT